MNEKIRNILNEQIKEEFYSAYFYLALAAKLEKLNLRGMANWLYIQAKEENDHALGLFKFLVERGEEPELLALAQPAMSGIKTASDIFQAGLKHERYITTRIYGILEAAREAKDYALESFIKWYIDEQVEEEAQATEIIEKLKLIGQDGSALYLLDQELAKRTYLPSGPYAAA
ncbi:MAG: ferritin [Patescibacteria group bacterium]